MKRRSLLTVFERVLILEGVCSKSRSVGDPKGVLPLERVVLEPIHVGAGAVAADGAVGAARLSCNTQPHCHCLCRGILRTSLS